MKVFVTGATGFVGSAVTRTLLSHGHSVVGLARSEESANKIKAAGATPLLGTLHDHAILTQAAKDVDAIIHTAFIHDFLSPTFDAARNAQVDVDALKAMVEGIRGTNKPLVATNGMMDGPKDRPIAEDDVKSGENRVAVEDYFREQGKQGVKTIMIRLAPSVHGPNDWGFVPALIGSAKRNGFSMLVDESVNWIGVHVKDAAELYRLAIEKDIPGGTFLHAVEDQPTPTKAIAELIAEKTGVPVKKVTTQEAMGMLGFIGLAFSQDLSAQKAKTVELTGWKVKEPGLLEDMKDHYFQ